jgi:hypothetical protein
MLECFAEPKLAHANLMVMISFVFLSIVFLIDTVLFLFPPENFSPEKEEEIEYFLNGASFFFSASFFIAIALKELLTRQTEREKYD